jgi:hypothetical protein
MKRLVIIGTAVVATALVAGLFIAFVLVRDILSGISGSPANPVCDRTLRHRVSLAAGQRLRSPLMVPAHEPQRIVFRSPSLHVIHTEVLASGTRAACEDSEGGVARECRLDGRREFMVRIANGSRDHVAVSIDAVIDRCANEASGEGAWTEE